MSLLGESTGRTVGGMRCAVGSPRLILLPRWWRAWPLPVAVRSARAVGRDGGDWAVSSTGGMVGSSGASYRFTSVSRVRENRMRGFMGAREENTSQLGQPRDSAPLVHPAGSPNRPAKLTANFSPSVGLSIKEVCRLC